MSGETTIGAVVDLLLDELTRFRGPRFASMGLYRAVYVVANEGKQDPQVSAREANWIKALRGVGFTMGEIALMCDRSKSTIHAVLGR